MIRVVARATALFVAVPFLTFASALAPTHVHAAPQQDEAPEIEHDDDQVIWADSPILHEAIYTAHPVSPAIPVSYETVQIARHWSVTPFDDATPVHGPPKPVPLFRGPPSLLV